MKKQEPRPAYHRRQDLIRLQQLVQELPVFITDEGARGYAVRLIAIDDPDRPPELVARFEVAHAFLQGCRLFHRLHLEGVDRS